MNDKIYANLKIPFFTETILNEIEKFAIEVYNEDRYDWKNEGLSMVYGTNGIRNKTICYTLLEEFSNDIIVDWCDSPCISITGPNTWLHKHSDTYGIKSKIIVPLLPRENFQPFMYHHTNGIVELVEMKLHQPILLDVDLEHGGFTTNDNVRATLQFTFYMSVPEIVEKIKNNQFLKTLKCSIC